MLRSNTLNTMFDDVIDDVNNDLAAPSGAVSNATRDLKHAPNATHYQTRTMADEGHGTKSLTRQTTTMVINVGSSTLAPVNETPSKERSVEVLECEPTSTSVEGEDGEEPACETCERHSRINFPPLIIPTSTPESAKQPISPINMGKLSLLSVDATSTLSVSSSEDNGNDTDETKSTDESIDFTEADHALDNMLDELRKLEAEAFYDEEENNRNSYRSSGSFTARKRRSRPKPPSLTQEQRLRFSIANFKGTEASNLDELLDEEESGDGEMSRGSASRMKALLEDLGITDTPNFLKIPLKLDVKEAEVVAKTEADVFSAEPPTPQTPLPTEISADTLKDEELIIDMLKVSKMDPETEEGRKHAKKIRIGLEKMKEALLGKVFVKVWNEQHKTMETIDVDQTHTARHLKTKMCRREGVQPGPEWCIAEKLPGLSMDRILQDSEYVTQAVNDWSRNTENHFVFLKRTNRYKLFREPHNYLVTDASVSVTGPYTEESKKVLLEEFFTKEATHIPNTESVLWMKDGRKKWAKHYFLLRPSGIYYTPKGQQKSRGLALLASFEHYNVYTCQGFKSTCKAPTDHVFAVKHPQVQTPKSKHVHVLCAGTREERNKWITFIRMAKYGYTMYEDYLSVKEQELAIAAGRRAKESMEVGGGTEQLAPPPDVPGAGSSPQLTRRHVAPGDSSTFPRAGLAPPKPPRIGMMSTSSAPGDLMPPLPPPLGTVPDVVPYGTMRKQRKKKTSKGSGEGSTSSADPNDIAEDAYLNLDEEMEDMGPTKL